MDECAQYKDFDLFSLQSTATDTWLTFHLLKSKDLQLQRAYNQNIVPHKGKGSSHTEKWIASGYSARTGLIAGNGYLEQRFPEEAMFPGEVNICDFLTVPLKDYKPVTIGWYYPKNSLLQELFDKYMLKLYQTGVLWKIENSYSLIKKCAEETGFTQMG